MLNWFKKRKKKGPVGILAQVGAIPSSEEWRRSATAVQSVVTFLSSEAGRNMLQVLANERPARFSLPQNANELVIARYLGYSEGYESCLNKMLLLAEPLLPGEEIVEEFKDDLSPPMEE